MRLPWLILLSGCGVRPEPTTWEALDVAGLQFELEHPTATLADLEAALGSLQAEVELAQAGTDTVEGVVVPHLATEPEDPYITPEDGQVQATDLFVRIACPGPDAGGGPDPEFDFGSVQVESPLLFGEGEVGVLQGDMLLTAADCLIGDATTNAVFRAVWEPVEGHLVAAGDIEVEKPSLPSGSLDRFSRLDLREGGPSRFSVDVGDDGYATVSPDPAVEGAWLVDLADGEVLCTFTPTVACESSSR